MYGVTPLGVTPPAGRGPALAVDRVPPTQRARGIAIVIIAYAAIFAAFWLFRGFLWQAIPILAVFAGVTIAVWGGDFIAVGADWLRIAGGRWVDITRLARVHTRNTTGGTWVELRDAEDRKVDVNLANLSRTFRVWETFYSALQSSERSGELVIDPATAAALERTDAALRRPAAG